ncbi:MAG: transcription initiation factor subunit alpha [Thermoplasmata archaeon]|nr:transcription initiation factor subunit alpha [Thermoplasmata archaeon]
MSPESVRIAEALLSRKEATDSELAEELGEKPSHIRKVLYDLYEARIAEYHKEKDKETGWLTFYWQINPQHASAHILDKARKDLQQLTKALEYEETHEFFVCPQGAERFDFARATESDFHCPEHGAILQQHDNRRELDQLRERVEALRRESTAS